MKSLVFIVTDKCNIKCDFCAPDCSPSREGYNDSNKMISIYDDMRNGIEIPLVVYTGGEPLLYQRDIEIASEYFKSCGVKHMRVVTNGFWGKTKKRALSTLSSLKKSGITEINISVDDFHQKFIPLETIKNAIDACVELDVRLLLAHKEHPDAIIKKETFDNLLGYEIADLQDYKRDNIPQSEYPSLMISTALTIPVGRYDRDIQYDDWIKDISNKDRWKGPCDQVLKNIIVSHKGNFAPCCGLVDRELPEFYFGDIDNTEPLETFYKMNNVTLYNWLALEGPSGIMEYIKTKNPNIEFKDGYVQNCQLCQELFQDPEKREIIKEGLKEKAIELSFKRCHYEGKRDVYNKVLEGIE
ncbi:MAG: radical SAM protein [Oligoflexia bacterium]|nr:radical SAM protein [Oligoflexia bacterium]